MSDVQGTACVDMDDVATLAERLRAVPGSVVTARLHGPLAPTMLALARATVAAVAAERAPATRVNAVVAGPAASSHAVAAAVDFLAAAAATTGQLIEIG